MKIDVLTLFPGMFSGVLGESIVKRAIEAEILEVQCHNFREFGLGKHRKVDDEPYGGGPGLVLRPEPVFESIESLEASYAPQAFEPHMVLLTPQGRKLNQEGLRELAAKKHILMMCGHYEGFDERIRQGFAWDEICIGDYVLSGGEVPAMVLIDGIARLLPGALGDETSTEEESFENNLLEYPQYTRPFEFRGMQVPEILLSGHHAEIARWRNEQARERTRDRRPDLLNEGDES